MIIASTIEELISVTQEMIKEESSDETKGLLEDKLIELQKLNEEYLVMKARCGN